MSQRDHNPLTLSRQLASGESPPAQQDLLGTLRDDPARFREMFGVEINRAELFGRPLALLMFGVALAADTTLELFLPQLSRHLRPFDRISLYRPDAIEVLLPESNQEQAQQLARKMLARAEDEQGRTQLRCAVGVYPHHGSSAEALLDACRLALRRCSEEQPVTTVRSARSAAPWPRQLIISSDAPVAQSGAMQHVYAMASRLAPSVIPVLIVGETGSGKEVVARSIHQHGPRSSKRMVALNCAAIPATLVESVLFGHERGAFTGALQQSQGIFEQASGGTVLLDEIGELALPAQAALLRALDTQRIRRVGASSEVSIDVRLLAATHRDLEQMCRQGRFRWDLYYRLNGFVLAIPPLRERREDIVPLARLFLRRAAADHRRGVPEIEDDVIARLERFRWPGNVRELRNAMEHAVVLARADRIEVGDLPQKLIDLDATEPPALTASLPESFPAGPTLASPHADLTSDPPEAPINLRAAVRRYEARLIVMALREAEGSRTRAAQQLGLSVRTLANRIKALGIKRLGFAIAGDDSRERSQRDGGDDCSPTQP